jgi:hypothetical protein
MVKGRSCLRDKDIALVNQVPSLACLEQGMRRCVVVVPRRPDLKRYRGGAELVERHCQRFHAIVWVESYHWKLRARAVQGGVVAWVAQNNA